MRPVGQKVLLKQDLPRQSVINGLHRLDEGVMGRPWEREGEVAAVGDINTHDLKVGDRVLVRLYSGNDVDVPGYTVINQENIVAVISDDVPKPVYCDGQGFW